jgi:hypothetical protein
MGNIFLADISGPSFINISLDSVDWCTPILHFLLSCQVLQNHHFRQMMPRQVVWRLHPVIVACMARSKTNLTSRVHQMLSIFPFRFLAGFLPLPPTAIKHPSKNDYFGSPSFFPSSFRRFDCPSSTPRVPSVSGPISEPLSTAGRRASVLFPVPLFINLISHVPHSPLVPSRLVSRITICVGSGTSCLHPICFEGGTLGFHWLFRSTRPERFCASREGLKWNTWHVRLHLSVFTHPNNLFTILQLINSAYIYRHCGQTKATWFFRATDSNSAMIFSSINKTIHSC